MKAKVFLNFVSFLRPHQLCCFTFTISQTFPGDSSPVSCASRKRRSAPALGLPCPLLFLCPWGRPGAGGAGVAPADEGGGGGEAGHWGGGRGGEEQRADDD